MKLLFALPMLCLAHYSFAQDQHTDSLLNVNGKTRDTVGVFRRVEVEADYPGGFSAWRNFLIQNLRGQAVADALPKSTKEFKQTAIVQFIVCTDGTLCEIRVVNDVHPAVKAEAERVLATSGAWVPAMQNGRKVKAYRKQPITFVVNSK